MQPRSRPRSATALDRPRPPADGRLRLLPWTLWLTFTLPSRHVTPHYDLAWVGFDVALLARSPPTAWCALRRRNGSSRAAATGTMLLCDAWFDVMTSRQRRAARSDRGGHPRRAPARGALRASSSTTRSGSARHGRALLAAARALAETAAARRLLEQAEPMLELRDAELELVELVARTRSSSSTSARSAPIACSESFSLLPRRGRAARRRAPRPRRGSGRYRVRPCGLERRRWRRFSRRACASGADGVATTASTSSGVGSAASACSDS